MTARPDFYRFHNGTKAPLQFSDTEYETRLTKLRKIMSDMGVDAAVFSSMHNISYFSGFTYCAFGRPYALVVTPQTSVTISAGIDVGQPWRRCYGDNLTYTDWQRDNYWRAIETIAGKGKSIGYESDHLSLLQKAKLDAFLEPSRTVDMYEATMVQHMHKSHDELELIRAGAAVADVGGYAIKDAIQIGVREIDVTMAGRDAMETEIAKRFPDAEWSCHGLVPVSFEQCLL